MAHYWIVVGSVEIFETTKALGFTKHGFKSTRRKMAGRVEPGDRIAFYVTHRKQFAGSVEVTSPMVVEDTRIWTSDKKPSEMYPYRVGIKPVTILEQENWLDAEPYHERFTWTQKWPRKNWTLAYQGNLHEIPEEDFAILQHDLEKAAQNAAVSA